MNHSDTINRISTLSENICPGICTDALITYIQETYHPVSLIVYGSYSNGTYNLNSDFDALVISSDHEAYHDTSSVNGIPLDVFVYPEAYFEKEYDCEEFVQIFDGKIIMDSKDIGKTLQKNVLTYISSLPAKTDEELKGEIDWCVKMCERAKRNSVEGMYRWHWVLTESLEIFCDIMHHHYFGPKKSLKWMEETCPKAYGYYLKALTCFDMESLESWILYLSSLKPE